MKKQLPALVVVLLVAVAFLAGYSINHFHTPASRDGGRKILCYVDPMHPAYRSDKPGIAPDCGMQLEPVYADGSPAVPNGQGAQEKLPPGTIQISPDKQQLIGVRLGVAERTAGPRTVRLLGRVAPDETRLYRINAATDMWIRRIYPPTTGSLVKHDERLVGYYQSNFLATASSYLYALETRDRQKAAIEASSGQADVSRLQIRQATESLKNMGVQETQLLEMEKSRKIPDLVDIRSPSAGFILARNVSLGQYVTAGSELYRIADLSRVWILADVYESDVYQFKPGTMAMVHLPHQGKTLRARVSSNLPQFDPVSRTLKLRLEADNHAYLMRPDMFVDIELPVSGAEAVTVPMEAVLDSGLKKTVFVDRGNGFFEPRTVETGHALGGRVEITRGLMPGEKIVVSGTFLIDSESRLKQSAAGITGTPQIDPVCGMTVDEAKSRAAGLTIESAGKINFFCSPECRNEFKKKPAQGAATGKPPAMGPSPEHHADHDKHGNEMKHD